MVGLSRQPYSTAISVPVTARRVPAAFMTFLFRRLHDAIASI